MCGLFAFYNFDTNKPIPRKEILEKSLPSLTHRGPDDFGIYEGEAVFLGSRRLKIIDLSERARMPMSNQDETIWLVFNGEIYNFLQLRKELIKKYDFKSRSDTEVILHLYEEYGLDCLRHLKGMFAFAIWDKRKKILFIARDRLGKKPVKYFLNEKFFVAASELKAILCLSEIPREIDFSALDEYLTYQYVPHPKTGFRGIFKLEPAHYLIVKQSGEIIKKRYWKLDFWQKLDLSESAWEKRVEERLKEAVRSRLISDVPLGAHLSGGIDSSLIVAIMAQELGKPVKTFTIGFKEADYNELPYARMVAKRYQTEHHEFMVDPNAVEILPKLVYHYEEPYADVSALPTWYLSEMTKKYATVALNGDGGDENFAGYTRYNVMQLWRWLRLIPFKSQLLELNRLLYSLTGRAIFRKGKNFLSEYRGGFVDFYLRTVDYFSPEEKTLIYQSFLKGLSINSRWYSFLEGKLEEAGSLSWLDKILLADINSYLPDDLLVKVDIASMAHSLEVRSPFLDHEFLELTAKMPSSFKMRGRGKKYLLKKIAYRYLPKECIDRPKQGFGVPLEYWFRGSLETYLKERLFERKFLEFGFKREGLEKLLSAHKRGVKNYSYHLWALLMLREWLACWFE